MSLATKIGFFGAAITTCFALAAVLIAPLASPGGPSRPDGYASAEMALLPIRVVQEHNAAFTGALAADTDRSAAVASPAQATNIATPAPDSMPEPPADEASSAPEDTQPVPAEPSVVPGLLSIPVPRQAPPPGGLNYALADQLITLINGARDAASVPQLSRHGSLMSAAESYATFHFRNHDPFALDHYLDGSPGDRAQRAGFSGLIGEVIAVGAPSAQQLFDTWMGSPPHGDILLDPAYAWIGLGCYQGPHVSNGFTFEAALCVGDVGG